MKESKALWRWLLWGVFTAITAFLASRHEPWYDEYHVWFMCRDMSLLELWRAMTEEGHFILWHLLVFPFAKLGASWWCLEVLSVAFVSCAAWLLVFCSPFEWPALCLILFSFPMVYDYPVVSRCYALIPPILFGLGALYHDQDKHRWLYCFLIGLLAHTHVFVEGLVAALFLLYLYEQVYLLHKAGKPVQDSILPAVLIIVMVLLAFIQVTGSLSYGQSTFDADKRGLAITLHHLGGAYGMFFTFGMRTRILHGDWLPLLPILIASVLLLAVVLVLLYRIFWKRRENRRFALVLLAAIGWQVLFSLFIYCFAYQRVYLPMLMVCFALWCVYEKDMRKETMVLLLILFLLTARDIPFNDINHSYCHDMEVYEQILDRVEPGTTVYVEDASEPMYFPLLQDTYDLRYLGPVGTAVLPDPPFWLVTENVLSLHP